MIKKTLAVLEKSLKQNIVDDRIKIRYRDTSTYECEIVVGDDLLIFIMNTNAMVFEPSNPINNTGYVTFDATRITCGMISVYNFLSDSFKYERRNDIGHLVARLFVNREKHFFVEGKKHLGVLFNDFSNDIISEEYVLAIIENAIQYCINIDPLVPPFELMKEISVESAMEYSLQASISSGKRLGFKFEKNLGDGEVR